MNHENEGDLTWVITDLYCVGFEVGFEHAQYIDHYHFQDSLWLQIKYTVARQPSY